MGIMKKKYINNKDLRKEIKIYKKSCKWDENGNYIKGSGTIHEELGRMIIEIAENFSTKPNFSGYTWKDDMISEAILTCVKYIHNCKDDEKANPFAYITTICYNSFVNYIKKQKNHSKIKDICYNNCYKLDNNIKNDIAINYELIKKNM